jgi:hypothetical protein
MDGWVFNGVMSHTRAYDVLNWMTGRLKAYTAKWEGENGHEALQGNIPAFSLKKL